MCLTPLWKHGTVRPTIIGLPVSHNKQWRVICNAQWAVLVAKRVLPNY